MSTYDRLRAARRLYDEQHPKRPKVAVISHGQELDLLSDGHAADLFLYTGASRETVLAIMLKVDTVIVDHGDVLDLRTAGRSL